MSLPFEIGNKKSTDYSTRHVCKKGFDDIYGNASTLVFEGNGDKINDIDKKIQNTAKILLGNSICCMNDSKLRIRKITDAQYNIAGKNVFVRVNINYIILLWSRVKINL